MLLDFDQKKDVGETILGLGQLGHAAHALLVASRLDEALAGLLQARMPNISSRLSDKLFKGRGPLSSFSSRIDLAYALGAIPASLRRNLHAIRDIRNEFAHSTKLLNFESPELLALMLKFPGFRANEISPLLFYLGKLKECMDIIDPALERQYLITALLNGPETSDTSPEKSEKPNRRRQRRSQGRTDKDG